jgi:FkbM family methyltransferase
MFTRINKLIAINIRMVYLYIARRVRGQLYCFIFTGVAKPNTKYHCKQDIYWVSELNNTHFILPQRGPYYLKGVYHRTETLVYSYCIDSIEFAKSDLIIDVGANNGDLISYFKDQRYIGFEPSPVEFNLLKKNKTNNCILYNLCVGDANREIDFYLSSSGADSSVYQPPNFESKVSVKQIRLDSIIDERVKLIKIDTEGSELEVVIGALNLLPRVEYVAIDLGFEKGVLQESTAPEVIDLLYQNNFKLFKIAKNERFLFKNTSFET